MKQVMLSTYDNPFDPFTQWDDWYRFDKDHGYNSSEYLDRIANTSGSLSDELNHEELERAIDEIIEFNPLGYWIKVERDVPVEVVEGLELNE